MYIITIFYVFLVLFTIYINIHIIREFIRTKGFRTTLYVGTNIFIQNIIIKYIQRYATSEKKLRILDIGSGCGKILFRINKKIKNVELVGYEIGKLYHSKAVSNNKYKNITFYNEDIHNLSDFNFDIIFTFLFERQQKELIYLYKKFPVGTIIISNTFKIPFEDDGTYSLLETLKSRILFKKIYVYKKML
jgi:SAM-dependent methyltransferase